MATPKQPPQRRKFKRKPTGRPPKITATEKVLAEIHALAGIQCTQREAAAVLGVSVGTFNAFMKRTAAAREAWNNGGENGKASLRRNQFNLAKTNAGMAIWLGKQLLGQRDPDKRIQLSGPDGGPIEFFDLTKVPDDDLKQLAKIFGAGAGEFSSPDRGGNGTAATVKGEGED